jgi:hypothetical protein
LGPAKSGFLTETLLRKRACCGLVQIVSGNLTKNPRSFSAVAK